MDLTRPFRMKLADDGVHGKEISDTESAELGPLDIEFQDVDGKEAVLRQEAVEGCGRDRVAPVAQVPGPACRWDMQSRETVSVGDRYPSDRHAAEAAHVAVESLEERRVWLDQEQPGVRIEHHEVEAERPTLLPRSTTVRGFAGSVSAYT
jgi:hypothetical protein